MRLIDADKVKQYALTEGFYCDTDADKKATASEIDELFPTVEAIPIKWIKAFSKQQDKKQYKDFLEFMLNYWNTLGMHALELWEEENGQ